MPAGLHDFTIEEGADFVRTITWTDEAGVPIDLTGYSARMQIRPFPGADGDPLIELTTANMRITLAGAGTIKLSIPATVTAALASWCKASYDLELVSGTGVVTRLLEGRAIFSPEVTQ